MRLDPGRQLAPATLEAIRDFVPLGTPAAPSDADLLLVALGIADGETRRSVAVAALASPSIRARLLRARAQVEDGLSGVGPQDDDLADLGRLSALGGSFSAGAAAAAFPERFGPPEPLRRLRERGWLREDQAGLLDLRAGIRTAVVPPSNDGHDAGWVARFVRFHVDAAQSLERLVAEGRWPDASAGLLRALPGFRAAWTLADRHGEHEAVETLALALAVALLDVGEHEALAGLAEAAYRASDALEKPRLRSLLLSFEGVAATRRGDRAGARELWERRVEFDRRVGNHLAVADARLDLAALAQEEGNDEGFRESLPELERAVDLAGREDFRASLWALRATDRRRAGDVAGALALARRALGAFADQGSPEIGLFVRLRATKEILACGRPWDASGALADLLLRCAEMGRAAAAAHVATALAEALASQGLDDLAGTCLWVSAEAHRAARTRHADAAASALEEFLAVRPGASVRLPFERWEAAAGAVPEEVERMRRLAAFPR